MCEGLVKALTFSVPGFIIHLTPIDALWDEVLLCSLGWPWTWLCSTRLALNTQSFHLCLSNPEIMHACHHAHLPIRVYPKDHPSMKILWGWKWLHSIMTVPDNYTIEGVILYYDFCINLKERIGLGKQLSGRALACHTWDPAFRLQ